MVKKHPPERDPEGFGRVRVAYEAAKAQLAMGVLLSAPDGDGASGPAGDEGDEPALEEAETAEPTSFEDWAAEERRKRQAMLEQLEALLARFEHEPESVAHEVLELARQGKPLGQSTAERLVFVAAWSGAALDAEVEQIARVEPTFLVHAQRLGTKGSAVWPQLPPAMRRLLACPPWVMLDEREHVAQLARDAPEVFLSGLLRLDGACSEAVDYLAHVLGIAPLGADPNSRSHSAAPAPEEGDGSLRCADSYLPRCTHGSSSSGWCRSSSQCRSASSRSLSTAGR